MVFAKRLREGVHSCDITCTVHVWMRPHVMVGNRYRMEEGEIEIDSIQPVRFPDITPQLARASGVLDLLNVAKHGRVEYHLPHPLSLHPTHRPLSQRSKATTRAIALSAQTPMENLVKTQNGLTHSKRSK